MHHFICVFTDALTGNISDDHKVALDRLKQNLHYMNPVPVVEYLYANKALSSEETEKIKANTTKNGKTTAILEKLEQDKDWVYYCLLDALHRSSQGHVLALLHGGNFYHNHASFFICV